MTMDKRKVGRATADMLRRITGIGLPFASVQWADPGPPERERVRKFLINLENRRALYNPMLLEVRSQVQHSISEIGDICTRTLPEFDEKSFANIPIRTIRAACREFKDNSVLNFPNYCGQQVKIKKKIFGGSERVMPEDPENDAGFFYALGVMRAIIGRQVAELCVHYDLDVEEDLASILPRLSEDE